MWTSLSQAGSESSKQLKAVPRLMRTRASAVRPAKARQMCSSTLTILRALRASCSLAALFRSAPVGRAAARSTALRVRPLLQVGVSAGRRRGALLQRGMQACLEFYSACCNKEQAAGAIELCTRCLQGHGCLLRRQRGSRLLRNDHSPSTTRSLPRTPTASVPRRTASRAYSTWNLCSRRCRNECSR